VTPFDDYPDDMSDLLPLDDATAEALLAGRAAVAARQDLAPVSAFLAEMRGCRRAPVPAPSPALALLLREGTSVEVAAGVGRSGAVAHSPTVHRPRGSAVSGWRRRLALAGVGLGAALTGVVGASAADLLPESVERAVATVVETLTPLEMPDEADGTDEPAVSGPGRDPAADVRPGDAGGPGGGGGGGAGGAEPTSPTGTSPRPGGAPAGPSVGGPAGPGGSTGAPPPGGVPVPDAPTPTTPGIGGLPSVPTTLPPAPPVTPPTTPGTATVPTTPSTPQLDPSDAIPLPW
jgi:hypothetical protein